MLPPGSEAHVRVMTKVILLCVVELHPGSRNPEGQGKVSDFFPAFLVPLVELWRKESWLLAGDS